MISARLHHLTLMTRRAQANVDFYTGFLGLRLVKRTGGFEDATQLHLFYGDAVGSPGSLVTFLVWEDGAPGRAGVGQAIDLALAVEPEGIGFWLTRCLTYGVRHQLPAPEFGEPCLHITDPDGIAVKLVGTDRIRATMPWLAPEIPPQYAVRRVRGATILSDAPEHIAAFLTRYLGLRPSAREAATRRLVSETGDVVDVRNGTGFWSGAPGTGTIDHIAFRAPDLAALSIVQSALQAGGAEVTELKDRRYFSSIYVREPAGTLLEVATDRPGMTVDEPPESLGRHLFVPPHEADRAEDIRVMLPRIALPGEERDMLVRRAALLRAMLPLDVPPAADLTGTAVLTVTGLSDPYGRYAPALNETLRKLGARVDARTLQAGHELTPEDPGIVQEWLSRSQIS